MVNVLATGSNGQLASEIKELSSGYSFNFYFLSKDELDILDFKSVYEFCQKNSIHVLINCAAYTAVDKAEDEMASAREINCNGVRNLATTCKELGIKLVHISTDYVFDGENFKPYTETDMTNPKSVYGSTKLEGELAMREINPKDSIIIRTSWVYSHYGANFVKTMLKLGRLKEKLGVIYDQVGAPTYAKDLAKIILNIVPKIKNENVQIYNYSNEGVLSWYDFAKEIMKMAKIECEILPIKSCQYPTKAPRPHFSVLDKSKIKDEFGIEIAYWKDGLDECLRRMGERR